MSEALVAVASEESATNPSVITTNKTAACAVSLGVAIVQELIGRDITKISNENTNELMATVINNELKL